ncbi:MAG TPA: hypothetical protein VHB21_28675, partial [Minicystis sp.]|nr:hypothetical protein [Minicystis sp.]
PLHEELCARFGTYARALARAGVPEANVAAVADRRQTAELLDEARRVAATDGPRRDIELRAFRLQWDAFAMARFGTWAAVAEAARVAPERLFRPFSPVLWDREGSSARSAAATSSASSCTRAR